MHYRVRYLLDFDLKLRSGQGCQSIRQTIQIGTSTLEALTISLLVYVPQEQSGMLIIGKKSYL